jgi:ATP-binding cassette, subfamily G (WHITE), eye pigment precursor transporter
MRLCDCVQGLDSTAAAHLVSTLHSVARRGRIVILTIHQPAAGVFCLFDRVLLLASGGRPCYYGARSRMAAFFALPPLNLIIPRATNPADFFIGNNTRATTQPLSLASW